MILKLETKLKAAKDHVDNKMTVKDVSEKYHIDCSRIKYYSSLYRLHGEKPFHGAERLTYSRELKLNMIKRCLAGESAYSLSLEIGSTDRKVVSEWVTLYKTKGESAIQTTSRRKKYLLKTERDYLKAHKKILKRNEYLEAENEILKKWYSLILQRNGSSEKK